MSEEGFAGRVSEWNEGMFKSARLNEIQDRINYWKLDLRAVTQGKHNYEWYIRDINNLLEEGWSKYSDKERKAVDEVRLLIEKGLQLLPPSKIIVTEEIGGQTTGFLFDDKNFTDLLGLCLSFERMVKDYNDKHGLTTMNKEEEAGWD